MQSNLKNRGTNLSTVLFAIYHHQRFLDLFEFAKSIDSCEDIEVILYVNNEVYSRYSEVLNTCTFKLLSDFDISDEDIKSENKTGKVDLFNAFIKYSSDWTLIRLLRRLSIIQIIQEKKYYKYLSAKHFFFLRIFKKNKVNIVFVTGDRHLHEEPAILKAAHDLGVIILLPYIVNYSEHERILLGRKDDLLDIDSLYSRYAKKKFRKYEHKGLHYYPFYAMNAISKFGALSKNPWVMGNGLSDILCVESQYTFDKFVDYGVEKEKLHLVGEVSYDVMHNHCKNRDQLSEYIFEKYDLKKDKQLIIISLPQLVEDQNISWDRHWEDVFFLLNSLTNTEQNILISLHPKMNLEKHHFLESKYKCKIMGERLKEVLPIADVFIGTYSSTIFWSVICGVKTMVIDFYDFNYSMYEHLTSISFVNNKLFFDKSLKDLLLKVVDFDHDWEVLSKSSVFDGKVVSRYIEIINNSKNNN